MADITKCIGDNCPIKEKCFRFTEPASMRQSYFAKPPFVIEKGKFECKMFWGENADLLFQQLTAILNDKKNGHTN